MSDSVLAVQVRTTRLAESDLVTLLSGDIGGADKGNRTMVDALIFG